MTGIRYKSAWKRCRRSTVAPEGDLFSILAGVLGRPSIGPEYGFAEQPHQLFPGRHELARRPFELASGVVALAVAPHALCAGHGGFADWRAAEALNLDIRPPPDSNVVPIARAKQVAP